MWTRAGTLLCALASGCGTAEITVLTTRAGADGGGAQAGADGGDAAGNDAGTRPAYCDDGTPGVLVSTAASGTPVCAGAMAATSFRYALCTCGDLAWTQPLATDSFDGSKGGYSAAAATVGGSVGANGSIQMGGPIAVAGSLWTGGTTAGFTSSFDAGIGGELHAGGLVDLTAGGLAVGTDAWASAGVTVAGNLAITGTLYVPSGAPVMAGGARAIGATVTGPVDVPIPCDCATGAAVSVGGFVETYRATNDDGAVGLDPHLLADVDAPLTMTLPCGRLFLTSVAAHAAVSLTISGRTALFVGGDFAASDDFTVTVPSGSTLDLFIEGNFVASRAFAAGDADNPASARIYVGGNGNLSLETATSVTANFYAPGAELLLGSAGTTLFGSAFVRQLGAASGPLTIHFDESIARAGADCPPPAACASCRDCENQACTNGACASCTASTDCCAPLVCRSGRCVVDVK